MCGPVHVKLMTFYWMLQSKFEVVSMLADVSRILNLLYSLGHISAQSTTQRSNTNHAEYK